MADDTAFNAYGAYVVTKSFTDRSSVDEISDEIVSNLAQKKQAFIDAVVTSVAGEENGRPNYKRFAEISGRDGNGNVSAAEMRTQLVEIFKNDESLKKEYSATPGKINDVASDMAGDALKIMGLISKTGKEQEVSVEAFGRTIDPKTKSIPLAALETARDTGPAVANNAEPAQPQSSYIFSGPTDIESGIDKLVAQELKGGESVVHGDRGVTSLLDEDHNGEIDPKAKKELRIAYRNAGLVDEVQITEKLKKADEQQFLKEIDRVSKTMTEPSDPREPKHWRLSRIVDVVDKNRDGNIDDEAKKPLLDSLKEKRGLSEDEANQTIKKFEALLKGEKFSASISPPTEAGPNAAVTLASQQLGGKVADRSASYTQST